MFVCLKSRMGGGKGKCNEGSDRRIDAGAVTSNNLSKPENAEQTNYFVIGFEPVIWDSAPRGKPFPSKCPMHAHLAPLPLLSAVRKRIPRSSSQHTGQWRLRRTSRILLCRVHYSRSNYGRACGVAHVEVWAESGSHFNVNSRSVQLSPELKDDNGLRQSFHNHSTSPFPATAGPT